MFPWYKYRTPFVDHVCDVSRELILNSRVFLWCVIVLITFHLGTWSRDLCTRPTYPVWFVTLGIYMYFCVLYVVIYLCCSLSSVVLVTYPTSPQYPTEWGSAAQKTGENLRCGPSVKSTSQSSPYLRVGHPGGSPVCCIAMQYRVIEKDGRDLKPL